MYFIKLKSCSYGQIKYIHFSLDNLLFISSEDEANFLYAVFLLEHDANFYFM